MHQLLLLSFLLSATLSAQAVISSEEQTPILATDLTAASGLGMDYDVRNFKILYTTTDAFGQPDTASGLVCVPNSVNLFFPFGVYNHGTAGTRESVPSRENVEERLLPQLMAGRGMVTVAPDYLGLGDSDGPHPYVHAATEVSAGKDMLIAVRDWLPTFDFVPGIAFQPGSGVFITGYSQGGHAAAALHRELSTNPVEGLDVKAAAHLSGPYSISEVMLNTLFDDDLVTLPGYIAYTYISYNYVYGLYDDLGDAFVGPYLPLIRSFANNDISLNLFNQQLEAELQQTGDPLSAIFQDSVLQILQERDTSNAIIKALIDNDTYDWAPPETTLIYYCTEDEQVPNENAFLADSVMRANGSVSVALQSGGALDHRSCVDPAFGLALSVFTALVETEPMSIGEVVDRPDVTVSPNPATAGTTIHIRGESLLSLPFRIYDTAGRLVADGETSSNSRIDLPGKLSNGLFILRLDLGDGTSVVRRIVVR